MAKKVIRFFGRLLPSLTLLLPLISHAMPAVIFTSFQDQSPISVKDSIEIQLDRLPQTGEGELRIFNGSLDLTDLFEMRSDGLLVLSPTIVELPPGSSVISVYLVDPGRQWQELAHLPVTVASDNLFKRASINRNMTVNAKSLVKESVSRDATPSERGEFIDASFNLSVDTTQEAGELDLASQWNIVGTSFREEALRFATEQNEAPRVDLSDYLVSLQGSSTAFRLGHVSSGNNPLLMDGIANRGVVLSRALGQGMDFSLGRQNGTAIVGYNNLLGITMLGCAL